MIDQIIDIMEEIFQKDIKEMEHDQITPLNIETWDSLMHLNLIVSIEDEFDMDFDADEIALMNDGLESILKIIESKL